MIPEKDKFIIDQFIMKGGRSLWLLDAVKVDSFGLRGSTMGLISRTNLDDQLFRYGVRINPNLLQDMNCGALRINTAPAGVQPSFRLFPWIYFPLLMPNQEHPVTRNLDLVKTQFPSTIDTVGESTDLKRTFLLFSSTRSRIVNAPARIDLDIINDPLDEKYFPQSRQPVAVLSEGIFPSVFQNRVTSEIQDSHVINFLPRSVPTKMVVVADGDIIRNQVKQTSGGWTPLPLGYDRHTDMTFAGNKDFILNAMNFLLDENGIIGARSKELKLRLLDKTKVRNEKMKWQWINTLFPILFIMLFGLIFNYLRKKKYRTIP
jgi:ABC-2 type transport system permease protein